MARGLKILFTTMVIVIGLLASLSGFFVAKTMTLEKKLKSSDTVAATAVPSNNSVVPTPATPAVDTTITTPAPTTTTTTPATTTPKPVSGAAGTYTVKAGDTMSSIAGQLNINWLDLAKANGMDAATADKIKIGQVLVLPK